VITLYQLHWSHYVEKVRWALDHKGVEWRAVEVEPFYKRQMRHVPQKTQLDSGARLHTVPAIHDEATGEFVIDSSAILAYLERHHPTPALFAEAGAAHDDVSRWLLWLDTEIGLAARRLAYTQVSLEIPGYLAELFLPDRAAAGSASGFKAQFGGAIVSGTLTQRFRFHLNREDRVFEQLEQCLLFVAHRLESQRYLAGDCFTAADIALCAFMRPTTVVPFFRNHPRLQKLYAWRDALLREHRREPRNGYETAMHEARRRRGWALGAVPWLGQPAERSSLAAIPADVRARNDQQPIAGWPLITGPMWYLRLRASCGYGRTPYAAND
jgi:glutathione S-transferase